MKDIKKIKLFIFTIIFVVMSVSCSQKKYTMRRLSDATGVESAIRANPNNATAIERLIDAVEYGNSSVRAEALWILGDVRVPAGYEYFIKYANDDPDFNVRVMAIKGIAKMQLTNEMAINKIRVGINDTSLAVQIEALKAAGILKDPNLLTTVLQAVSSKNRWVKIAAIKALKDYEGANVDRVLRNISTSETDNAIAETAKQVIEYRANKA